MARDSTRAISGFFDLGFRRRTAPGEHTGSYEFDVSPEPQAKRRRSPARGAPGKRILLVAAILAVLLMVALAVRLLSSGGGVDGGSASAPWILPVAFLGILIIGAVLLGLLATLLHFLRQRRNPLYWELACWGLVVVGIIVRQVVVSGFPSVTLGAMGVSAVVGVAILPGLMRWLNRISEEPGLQHVAVPFSLGFFVDLAQTLASTYVVALPWMPT